MTYAIRTSWGDSAEQIEMGERFCDAIPFCAPSIKWKAVTDAQIESDPKNAAFLRQNATDPKRRGSYRWDAAKWFRKVAALNYQPWPDAEWMLWFDADVEFTAPVTREALDAICTDDADLVFLGRPWAYASETGFVAYRMTCPDVRELLCLMLDFYLSGRVFGHDNWGDAYAFDLARSEGLDIRERDLTGHLDPATVEQNGMHVWPQSPLAKFSVHHKGPKRKAAAYG